MRILIIGGRSRSLITFRKELILEFRKGGHEVLACAGEYMAEVKNTLSGLGVGYIPIKISRAGTNPFQDISLLFELVTIFKQYKPDIVFAYTIKPIVWGSLAAKISSRCKIFSMIEGLGYPFMPADSINHYISALFARSLYRLCLRFSKRVFFLNPDDLSLFNKSNFINKKKAILLNGIGVNNKIYDFHKIKGPLKNVRFLMVGRLLRDKGIYEYLNTARVLQNRKNIAFSLAGAVDTNPSSIKWSDLNKFIEDGSIEYLGFINDIKYVYVNCDVYVLPSYREGTPRTVLEAMATGRAIITTDAPGCRETINLTDAKTFGSLVLGKNGILIPARNTDALVHAVNFLVRSPDLIKRMGEESRKYAVQRYDIHKVNKCILESMGI
ncbi:MAG: glycosyltransferase family 4 protein [Bacteroidota bacterium]